MGTPLSDIGSYWDPRAFETSSSMSEASSLCLACEHCERTRKTRDRAGVSLVICPDAAEANCVGMTKTLPWYSHALHKSHRHLHLEQTRLVQV
jgi:hypothetical protein